MSKSSFRVILGQEDLFLYCFSDLGEKRTVAHINLPLCIPWEKLTLDEGVGVVGGGLDLVGGLGNVESPDLSHLFDIC